MAQVALWANGRHEYDALAPAGLAEDIAVDAGPAASAEAPLVRERLLPVAVRACDDWQTHRRAAASIAASLETQAARVALTPRTTPRRRNAHCLFQRVIAPIIFLPTQTVYPPVGSLRH